MVKTELEVDEMPLDPTLLVVVALVLYLIAGIYLYLHQDEPLKRLEYMLVYSAIIGATTILSIAVGMEIV